MLYGSYTIVIQLLYGCYTIVIRLAVCDAHCLNRDFYPQITRIGDGLLYRKGAHVCISCGRRMIPLHWRGARRAGWSACHVSALQTQSTISVETHAVRLYMRGHIAYHLSQLSQGSHLSQLSHLFHLALLLDCFAALAMTRRR